MKTKILVLLLIGNLLFTSCDLMNSDKEDEQTNRRNFFLLLYFQRLINSNKNFDTLSTYYSTMKNFELKVVYETGAEPYSGTFFNSVTGKTTSIWQILEDNLKSVFQTRNQSMSFIIPKELSLMQSIGSTGQTSWTTDQLISLGKKYRSESSTETTGRFFVAFLNGYFSENGTVNQNVIGVSLSGTPYIFIFKPVINSVTPGITGITPTKVYVEQSTLVHEFGHTLGLVNNGFGLTTSHHDSAKGAHCTNNLCNVLCK